MKDLQHGIEPNARQTEGFVETTISVSLQESSEATIHHTLDSLRDEFEVADCMALQTRPLDPNRQTLQSPYICKKEELLSPYGGGEVTHDFCRKGEMSSASEPMSTKTPDLDCIYSHYVTSAFRKLRAGTSFDLLSIPVSFTPSLETSIEVLLLELNCAALQEQKGILSPCEYTALTQLLSSEQYNKRATRSYEVHFLPLIQHILVNHIHHEVVVLIITRLLHTFARCMPDGTVILGASGGVQLLLQSISNHNSSTTIIVSAFDALAFFCKEEPNRIRAGELLTIEVVVSLPIKHGREPHVQESAMKLIAVLCEEVENCKIAHRCGAVNVPMRVIRHTHDNDRLLTEACRCYENLIRFVNEDSFDAAMSLYPVQNLTTAMLREPNNAELHRAAMSSIRYI